MGVPDIYTVGSTKGTDHASPYNYDTHVPLLVFGSGIQPGIHSERVTPQAAAAILAGALNIPTPASAEAPIPDRLFVMRP